MKPLSPQAQAVMDAIKGHPNDLHRIASAALRAAADQTAYRIFPGLDVINAGDLHDIAAELEGGG